MKIIKGYFGSIFSAYIILVCFLISAVSCKERALAPSPGSANRTMNNNGVSKDNRSQGKSNTNISTYNFFEGEGEELKQNCNKSVLYSYNNMPIHHDQSDRGTFTYYYQFKLLAPELPTIVYFPGGPGGDSINSEQFEDSIGHYNQIYIDPRGVGCNFGGKKQFRIDELTTRNHALDVVTVIKHLKLDNYVIYGISYGTLVGTVTAFEAEKTNYPPKSVLLEGIVGATFTKNIRQTYEIELNKIFGKRREYSELFKTQKLPLGHSAAEWTDFFKALLTSDGIYVQMALESLIKFHFGGESIYQVDSLWTLNDLDEMMREYVTDPDPRIMGEQNFYVSVACREIFDPVSMGYPSLENGRFKLSNSRELEQLCHGLIIDSAYDSQNYQIKAPLYYVQGGLDPATPYKQARYHFNNQRLSRSKTWIDVDHGSHSPLLVETQLADCAKKIWDRVVNQRGVSDLIINSRCQGDQQSDVLGLTGGPKKKLPFPKVRRSVF